jgi:signal transduction histidine kinase
MCFELIAKDQLLGDSDNKVEIKLYFKIKQKKYLKNDEEKVMMQIVDITKTIMYEEVYAQNQFLAITNATVSHELRNPLQSITSQNLKISLCLKELIKLISNNDDKPMREMKKPIKSLVQLIQTSNSI